MDRQIIIKLHKNFEDCAHNKNGVEFWYARELFPLLGYTRWEGFESVIKRAKEACFNAGSQTINHFQDVTKMVKIGSEMKALQKNIKKSWLMPVKNWMIKI